MITRLLLILCLVSPFATRAATGSSVAADSASKPPPLIVLKLDDMVSREGTVPARWMRLTKFTIKRRIKIGAGIICVSLENASPDYIDGLKKLRASRLVEYWIHGYDHKRWQEPDGKGGERTVAEFRGTSRVQQSEHLAKSQELGIRLLGEPFPVFGAV